MNSRVRWLRRANRFLRFGAPALVALLFWWYQGRFGFNPTDDGFVLAQSWRLLHGQIPHVDFTSPRPLGSAILHMPELLVPWGTLAFSRLVVVFQLLWIAIATVEIFPVLNRSSALERFSLVAIAFFVNVGAWPLFAWHTIDGLFIGATVLWLAMRPVPRGRLRYMQWGILWFLAGFAPLIKQGFVAIPILVVLLLIVFRQWRVLRFAPLAAVPGLIYLVVTSGTPGGLTGQLYSGSSQELLQPLKSLVGAVTSTGGLLVMVCVIGAVFLLRSGKGPRIINVAFALGLVTAPTLMVGWAQLFALSGSWSYLAVVGLLTLTVLLARDLGQVTMILVVLGLGYGISMSWGVPAPSLLAGTVLVFSIFLVLGEDRSPSKLSRDDGPIISAVVLIFAVIVSGLVLEPRARQTYAELPRAELTTTVDDPRFALIQMSAQSSAYVEDVKECLAKYPASDIAILPDGAGLYPLLGMRNPFESDWWLPAEESPDHHDRVAARISELNLDGDWLVLSQSFGLFDLPSLSVVEVGQPGSPFAYSPEDRALLAGLDGSAVECGSLTGKYSAP